jgi:hypothetical protein
LIDEMRIDLMPVLLAAGVCSFGYYRESTLLLDGAEIVQGDRVTHLHSKCESNDHAQADPSGSRRHSKS